MKPRNDKINKWMLKHWPKHHASDALFHLFWSKRNKTCIPYGYFSDSFRKRNNSKYLKSKKK